MSFKQRLHRSFLLGGFALVVGLAAGPSAKANVYATNIKLNDNPTNAVMDFQDGLTISYILNEDAALGVTVQILNGTNILRTLSFPGSTNGTENPGSEVGLNLVTWDGRDNYSNIVAPGTYSVSVTAGTSHTNWAQISNDGNTNVNVWSGNGIAVDRNPASPYYGRVFVANSLAGPSSVTSPAYRLGVSKFNADGSEADEGAFNNDTFAPWASQDLVPWKVEVSDDDFVYASDLAHGGELYRWDPTLSTNSQLYVLRRDNVTNRVVLTGHFISGSGTNTQIWAADSTNHNSLGVMKWMVGADGTCASNDFGGSVVAAGPAVDLSLYPGDVALDGAGSIYTCQPVNGTTNLARVLCFPAYDPATNGGAPETTALWSIVTNDSSYSLPSGIAVDPSGTYVAVAFQGFSDPDFGIIGNGGTRIFSATNGNLVASLDFGVPVNADPSHQDTDCAWDAVGNIYYIDTWLGFWRVFSPPGTNVATTHGLATVEVPVLPPPTITNISVSSGTVTIIFTGVPGEAPSAFMVLSATDARGPYTAVTNANITSLGSGTFQATVPVNGSLQFYKVVRKSSLVVQRPYITSLSVAGGTVTLNFTGAASDSATAFTVLSAVKPTGPYASASGANVSVVSAGVFRATVPVTGPAQFYRIQR